MRRQLSAKSLEALSQCHTGRYSDSKGHSYVYTVVGPGSYLRAEVTVDHVEGEEAILSAGPQAVPRLFARRSELYGAETGLK